MNRTEIEEFKRFLHVRELYPMFSAYYRQSHLTTNPSTLEDYLEKAKAESVIPMAFVYPKSIYGKDFWLAIHEEWNQHLQEQRADRNEADQLSSLHMRLISITFHGVRNRDGTQRQNHLLFQTALMLISISSQ